jgi:hypothetical protein
LSFERASGARPIIKEQASAMLNVVRHILNLRTIQFTILNIDASARQCVNTQEYLALPGIRITAGIKSPAPNPYMKLNDTVLESFFLDQTGCLQPAAGLTSLLKEP